jgi:hypothetical protein
VQEFIPYLLRVVGERVLHIGDSGFPLCGVTLIGKVERIYLPLHLGPAHGICGECKAIYESSRERSESRP